MPRIWSRNAPTNGSPHRVLDSINRQRAKRFSIGEALQFGIHAMSWAGAEGYEYLMGRWSRILAPKFLEWAQPPQDEEVLDVGCGTGVLSEALLSRGAKSVVGIDPSAAYVEYASARVGSKGGASFRAGNAMDLPFPNDSFGRFYRPLC